MLLWPLLVSSAIVLTSAHPEGPTPLACTGDCLSTLGSHPVLSKPSPAAWRALPLGSIAPRGWLLEQLLLQANSLSGFMPTSTFPGAVYVNTSMWVGGHLGTGTDQWLPYWANGNVPLLMLLRAAGKEAMSRLDPASNFEVVVDGMIDYVLGHTNRTTGWIGPFLNEPGDSNGHGLWDPLNMLRALLMYAEGEPASAKRVAAAVVAHLTAEYGMLKTDPVYKWASTRWPTFVQVCLYVIDILVPAFGSDDDVMPLGPAGTTALLMNASALFQAKGMNWDAYYSRTGSIKFPLGPVTGWNTNDHGVNNAEGALAWPAMAYRLSGSAEDASKMNLALSMIDR